MNIVYYPALLAGTAVVALAMSLTGVAHAEHPSEGVSQSATVERCTFTTELSLGSRGTDVLCLQEHLMKQGYLTEISKPTGYFGRLTLAAVKSWQTAVGVIPTGVVSKSQTTQPKMSPVMGHHEPVDVTKWKATPGLKITVHTDAMDGWNLEIKPENFIFAPEHVNQAVVENEGHAHLYIDGVKRARVYGLWFSIPSAWLPSDGSHDVRVTLNANDHSELSNAGTIVEATSTITVSKNNS